VRLVLREEEELAVAQDVELALPPGSAFASTLRSVNMAETGSR
jgi:hypothetical protein